ncbi:hypothetical protein [Rhodococcus qingshengii]|uniref:hypothetical protein n=1 Tax=Rhodococcus qingshengii TaxID=334542 RepID=UPI0035DBB85E
MSLEKEYGVAVYQITQVYGGPEEGGWWYEKGILEYVADHLTLPDAIKRMEELRTGRYKSSELMTARKYQVGVYDLRVLHPGEGIPSFFPDRRPRYE